jgi:EAL and modified HD-GYP domain-containing signal transduction protein
MDIFIARQPIFDKEQNVFAYEMLFRDSGENSFNSNDPDAATAKVLLNIFQTFGVKALTNDKIAFVNFSENILDMEFLSIFPSEYLGIELLEPDTVLQTTIETCKSIKNRGHKLSIDCFKGKNESKDLYELADIVKINFINLDKVEIEKIFAKYKNGNTKFLADKVETREDFAYARMLGFDLFQGYFFSKPEIMTTKDLSPLKMSYMQLMIKINKENIDFDEIADVISRDLSLTYSLLKMVNTLEFGLRKEVDNVKHALVVMGEKKIRKWVSLLILTNLASDKPEELVKTSLIRARFGELIVQNTKNEKMADTIFLAGLFSLIDVILDRPLKEVLEEIQISKELKECLLNYKNNSIRNVLDIVLSYEKGDWNTVLELSEKIGTRIKDISDAYINTLTWYFEFM